MDVLSEKSSGKNKGLIFTSAAIFAVVAAAMYAALALYETIGSIVVFLMWVLFGPEMNSLFQVAILCAVLWLLALLPVCTAVLVLTRQKAAVITAWLSFVQIAIIFAVWALQLGLNFELLLLWGVCVEIALSLITAGLLTVWTVIRTKTRYDRPDGETAL